MGIAFTKKHHYMRKLAGVTDPHIQIDPGRHTQSQSSLATIASTALKNSMKFPV